MPGSADQKPLMDVRSEQVFELRRSNRKIQTVGSEVDA
ncbi:hypothetical protein SynPROS91_00912 [Synechococcus sp. PROS-9-1]|nr:hypothetical protein SynPROS91_00912 [Synechococcus sp. PROS-9-1]